MSVYREASLKRPCLTLEDFAKAVEEEPHILVHKHRAGIFCAAKKGSRGRGRTHLYSVEQIQQYRDLVAAGKPQHKYLDGSAAYTAADAKRAFELMAAVEAQGRPHEEALEACVTILGIHPAAVVAISQSRHQLQKGCFVSAEVLAKINRLPLDGPMPIVNEADLLEVLEALARGTEVPCTHCGKGLRSVCAGCYRRAAAPPPEPPPAPAAPLPEPLLAGLQLPARERRGRERSGAKPPSIAPPEPVDLPDVDP